MCVCDRKGSAHPGSHKFGWGVGVLEGVDVMVVLSMDGRDEGLVTDAWRLICGDIVVDVVELVRLEDGGVVKVIVRVGREYAGMPGLILCVGVIFVGFVG